MRALILLEQAFTITNMDYPLVAVCVIRLQKGPLQKALEHNKKDHENEIH
jgi:hypothetical protein